MNDLERALNERLSDINSVEFRIYKRRNNQTTSEMETKVKEIISENGLTVSEAKGFLEYMKLVIDASSYLPRKK